MTRTPIYIVCSPRPLVGKTLLSRMLCEFLALQRGALEAYDISLKEPSLRDHLPDVTEIADIGATAGKMALMDRLIVADGIAKVIDLGFHAFDEFFVMSADIGFIKEAARRGLAPTVLFIGDGDRLSTRAYDMLGDLIPRAALVVVDNEQVARGELPDAMAQGRLLRVAALPPFLRAYVDRVGFSFTHYLRGEPDHSTELHQWIRANFFSFRELEMQLLLMR